MGSDWCIYLKIPLIAISIHAPRMGSDGSIVHSCSLGRYFNPRSPHGERPNASRASDTEQNFNPRSPHGERRLSSMVSLLVFYFNPRSPHGERRGNTTFGASSGDFNPRSPHGERQPQFIIDSYIEIFQSTLPAWGATSVIAQIFWRCKDFNPRSPHGERHIKHYLTLIMGDFNPRSPHGERRRNS